MARERESGQKKETGSKGGGKGVTGGGGRTGKENGKGTGPESRVKGFSDTVDQKAARRLKARRTRNRGVWFGMGMFGLVGWTVAIYTVLGIALGVWLDNRWPGTISWTLTLLLLGLGAGIYNAWYWVQKEIEPPGDDED